MLAEATPSIQSVADFVGQWWIVRVKSCLGGRLRKELSLFNLNFWYPTETYVRKSTDKHGHTHRRKVERSRMGGYLFLCGDDDACSIARRSLSQCSVRFAPRQEQFRQELASLQILLSNDTSAPVLRGFPVGKRVRVKSGTFIGMIGVVDSLDDENVIVKVGLTIMGLYTPTPIHPDDLESL